MFRIAWMHDDLHISYWLFVFHTGPLLGPYTYRKVGTWVLNHQWLLKKNITIEHVYHLFLSWIFCQPNHPTGRHPAANILWLGCSGLPGLQNAKWRKANLPLQSWNYVDIQTKLMVCIWYKHLSRKKVSDVFNIMTSCIQHLLRFCQWSKQFFPPD